MDDPDRFRQQAAHWRQWAPHYDADSAGHLDPDPAVQLLHDLAGRRARP